MAAGSPAPDALAVHNSVTRIIKGGICRYYSRFKGSSGCYNLKGGTRIHIVFCGYVFYISLHAFISQFPGRFIGIKIRPVCHSQNVSGVGIHYNAVYLIGTILIHGVGHSFFRKMLNHLIYGQNNIPSIDGRNHSFYIGRSFPSPGIGLHHNLTWHTLQIFVIIKLYPLLALDSFPRFSILHGKAQDMGSQIAVGVVSFRFFGEINSFYIQLSDLY